MDKSGQKGPATSAVHTCIMCRDFQALDELAIDCRLANIKLVGRSAAVVSRWVRKKVLSDIYDQIVDKDRAAKIQKVQDAIKAFEQKLKKADPSTHASMAEEYTANSNALKRLQDDDAHWFQNFVVQLVETAVEERLLTWDDHVGRARLLCVWIASSISYEYSQEIISSEETGADIIRREKSFCAGYAQFFVLMFNALLRAEPRCFKANEAHIANFEAVWVLGNIKWISTAWDGSVNDPHGSRGHAWATFPMGLDAAGGEPIRKIVDPCWIQRSQNPVMISPEWFYNSALTMLRTHMPVGGAGTAVPVPYRMNLVDWRNNDLAAFTDFSVPLQIEESSLLPATRHLSPLQQQTVQFSRLCVGSKPLTCTLYLVPFINSKTIFNSLAVPFALAAGAFSAPTFSATIDTKAINTARGPFQLMIAVPVTAGLNPTARNIDATTVRGTPEGGISWMTIVEYWVTNL